MCFLRISTRCHVPKYLNRFFLPRLVNAYICIHAIGVLSVYNCFKPSDNTKKLL